MKSLAWALLLGLPLAAAAVPQDEVAVERVAEALSRGDAAEQAGDGKALREAARQLDQLGARPAETAIDQAARWRATAGGVDIPYRGRALGPAYRRGTLPARTAISTEQVFLAGQKAVVAVAPQQGRTLSLQINEPGSAEICNRSIAGPRAACAWLPMFTRRVQIRIVNASDEPASYYLVSN